MSLQAEDIEFIKTHIAEWLADQSLARPPAVYEVELRERLVRVEETLESPPMSICTRSILSCQYPAPS